jgi:polyhydroxyalkanoate synthesis regulator phasin
MQKKHIAVWALLALVSMVGFGFASDASSLSNLPTMQPKVEGIFKLMGPSSTDPIRVLPPIQKNNHKDDKDSTMTGHDKHETERNHTPRTQTGSVGTGRVGDDYKPKWAWDICTQTWRAEKLAAEYARKQVQIAKWWVMMTWQVQELISGGKITTEQATKYMARIQEQLKKKTEELTKRYTEKTQQLSIGSCKKEDRASDRKLEDSTHKSGSWDDSRNETLKEITKRATKLQHAINKAKQDGSISSDKAAEYEKYISSELQKKQDTIAK